MNKRELLQLYKKICRRSSDPEVYRNNDLWMENSVDVVYVYAMIQISDTIDVLKERIEDKQEDSAAVENFKAMLKRLEADFSKRKQSERFKEIKRKYL